MSARAYEHLLTLPTYRAELASRLAPLFQKGKVDLYPYTYFVRTGKEARPHTYRMLALENRHLRALIAPELGGRVYSLRDKRLPTPPGREGPGAELLYDNPIIKPYRIEPRNAWISAGIEFNFPIAHSHTSLEPVASRLYQADGRAYVEVGECERRLGLSWVIRLSLGDDDTFLTQETFLHNPTPNPATWHFWSNAGIEAFDETEMVFPPATILVHGTKDNRGRWPADWSRVGDREGMLGLFWLDQTDVYFGAFHHGLGVGLMHLADPEVVPGMKMWTFGRAGTREWAKHLSDGTRGYAEVQSGAFKTQEETGTFAPGESAYLVEFWTGAGSVEDYARATLPEPVIAAPLPQPLGMDHMPEARRWLAVLAAHEKRAPSELPEYDPADIDWPPTGLELEAALRWAIEHRPAYRAALGTWLVARKRYAEASAALEGASDPYARRVRGIVAWRVDRDLQLARKLYDSVEFRETGHLLEHDALLAHVGDHEARYAILGRLNAQESRVAERLADAAAARGLAQEAIDQLLGRPWPRQHERFIRTDIWRRARATLGLPQDPVPEHLGEDPVPPASAAPTPHGPADGILRRISEP